MPVYFWLFGLVKLFNPSALNANEDSGLWGQSWPATSFFEWWWRTNPPLSFRSEIQFTKRACVVNMRLHFKWRLVLISGFHWNTDLLLLQPWCRVRRRGVNAEERKIKVMKKGRKMGSEREWMEEKKQEMKENVERCSGVVLGKYQKCMVWQRSSGSKQKVRCCKMFGKFNAELHNNNDLQKQILKSLNFFPQIRKVVYYYK